MTDAVATRHRPVVVTIALVLVYLSALSNVAIGILVLLSRYDVPESDKLWTSLLGAGIILLGLLMIALASAISRGSRFARGLLSAYLAISVALRVVTYVATDDWDLGAMIGVVVDVLVLAALWLPPGARFFARARDASAPAPAPQTTSE